MKKLILAAVILFSCCADRTNAQVSVQVNVGVQPLWGPPGYDYVHYYYIPDLDAYYDVPAQQYMFFDHGRWIAMRDLPPQYRGFDIYRAYKVVINDPTPWYHHERYRSQYATYRGHHDQMIIRDSRDQRYWVNPNHPHHNEWHGDGRDHRGERDHGHDDHHDRDEGRDRR